jgi:hypothetical protein
MNPSGGLRWHWRAWRSQRQWQGTREHLAQWLESVQPASDQLLLLGPSAGWLLPSAFLTRFGQVHCWDIDPLAPFLFARRHGAALRAAGVSWTYQRGDAWANLDKLLAAHPEAAVLFDNLLGQLRFHGPGTGAEAAAQVAAHLAAVERRITGLRRRLAGREWGSVHDLLSGPGRQAPPDQDDRMRRRKLRAGAPLAQDAWLAGLQPQSQWLDHLTAAVFAPGTTVYDIAWPFKPGYWHWLQAGWVAPSSLSR